MFANHFFRPILKQAPPALLSVFAALSAFGVYSCMYAFRKPFTVATFEGMSFAGVDYKVWLVIAQTIGYTCSKLYGMKFIAELSAGKRAVSILVLMGVGWLSLLFFALVPAPYNIFFLLINGFPLGMVWGIVFSYLEGRRTTEFMGAVLSTSFIFSSGFVKSVGKWTIVHWRVSEWWMPFVTGLIFLLPTLLFVMLLDQIPAPSEQDVQMRTQRLPMNGTERKKFVRAFLPGLILLIIAYVLLTILRDLRDNFAADMWKELGYGGSTAIFTQTEVPVSLVVLLLMSLLVLVKNNFSALLINHGMVIGGFLLAGMCTWLFVKNQIDPVWWMSLTGVGLYAAYIPFNCILFERMIAAFKYISNAGFAIYVADSFGYLGSAGVVLIKNLGGWHILWSRFFINVLLYSSLLGTVLMIFSAFYFFYRYHRFVKGLIRNTTSGVPSQ